MNKRGLIKTTTAIVAIFLLSGCAGNLRNIKPGKAPEISDDNSIVFGRVAFLWESGADCHIIFKNTETAKIYHMSTTDGPSYLFRKNDAYDGYVRKDFFVELPPGNYKIHKIRIQGYDMYQTELRPDVFFDVEPNSVVYIGALTYVFEEEKDYILHKTGTVNLTVYDESEKAIEKFHARYPSIKKDVKVSLMKIEN